MEDHDLHELCNIFAKRITDGWSLPKWLADMLPYEYVKTYPTHYVIDWKEHGL